MDFLKNIPIIGGIFDDPFGTDAMREGLSTASRQSRELGEYLKNFQMQGLDKSLGYFQPVQQQIQSVYGPPGSFRK